MNGHIVGYSPFTLKLRNGKTWRWIQTWAKCTGRAKKNQNAPNAPASSSSADLQATSRDAGSIPRRSFTLQQPTAHSLKIIFQVSPEPRSWGRGHSSPPEGGSDRTPRPARDPRRASLSGIPTAPAGRRRGLGYHPRVPRRMQRRREESSGSGTSCSHSLPEPLSLRCPDSPSSAHYCSA